MLTKDSVKEMIDHMPDTFTVDDMVDQLILLDKVDRARNQIKNGEFLTEDELNAEIDSWE